MVAKFLSDLIFVTIKGYNHKQQQTLNQNVTTEHHEQAPLYLPIYQMMSNVQESSDLHR